MREEIVESMVVSFEDITKEFVLIQIDQFNLKNKTEVERIVFKEIKNGYKAYVKFKKL